MARSSSPSFLATQMNTQSTTAAVSATLTATTGVTTTPGVTSTNPVSGTQPVTPTETALGPFKTILTGNQIANASLGFNQQTGEPLVQFQLTDEGAKIFSDFTTKNVGQYLTIVLDKRVISSPRI